MEQIFLLLSRYFYYKPIELRAILEGFKNLKDVMEAPKDAFLSLGIRGKALDEFLEKRSSSVIPASPSVIPAKAGIQASLEDIKTVTILDENYPKNLKNIYDPPPILFYRGNLELISPPPFLPLSKGEARRGLAVVGSRKISEYGRRVCETLVGALCPHFTIVSGLAYGIDGLSHEITVKNNQKAIAVLGSGLDDESIYPKMNINLAKKILDCGGLLLSEIPPGIGPQKFHFPMRNRIISALSEGILIVEGGIKSGTLITAKLGLDSGADIFAVPGNIFSPNSEGVNYLIKCGAHPVTEARDILEFYGIDVKETPKDYAPKTEKEKIILEILSGGEKHIDGLSASTKIEIMELMTILTDLEIEGAVKNIGGKFMKNV